MSNRWRVKLAGPARRALDRDLPESVAWAAYAFLNDRLTDNPHRAGAELSAPYRGLHSARLGTYRVIYRIEASHRTVHVLVIRCRADV